MSPKSSASRARSYSFRCLPQPRSNSIAEILQGFRLPKKILDPKYFYDFRGSQLYEKITESPDYYVTRSENEILRRYAAAIAAAVGRDAVIIEPGSGSCKKIEYLLDALKPSLYVPIDISVGMLEASCSRLASHYQWLSCFGIAAELDQLDAIADFLPDERRVVFFPGSTIGNFEPDKALSLLQKLRKLLQSEGGVLIGVDNVKDIDILERAYNDRNGITAAFNKNSLCHINRIAPANFTSEVFDHHAYFNSSLSRIEMHLVSQCEQTVEVAGEKIHFGCEETIHTENSYKYTPESFCDIAAKAGFICASQWSDQRGYFTLYYLKPTS